nr:MAG TPA: hypothetical protein [Caudoviricetes sp.]
MFYYLLHNKKCYLSLFFSYSLKFKAKIRGKIERFISYLHTP